MSAVYKAWKSVCIKNRGGVRLQTFKNHQCQKLNDQEIKYAIAQTQQRRDRMSSELDRIRRKYRRSTQTKYFDEIIEEWADNQA